jgi:hypothetical protein
VLITILYVTQCLAHVPAVQALLCGEAWVHHRASAIEAAIRRGAHPAGDGMVLKAVGELLTRMWDGEPTKQSMVVLLREVGNRCPRFARPTHRNGNVKPGFCKQEDAHEYFLAVFDSLLNDLDQGTTVEGDGVPCIRTARPVDEGDIAALAAQAAAHQDVVHRSDLLSAFQVSCCLPCLVLHDAHVLPGMLSQPYQLDGLYSANHTHGIVSASASSFARHRRSPYFDRFVSCGT